MAKLFIKVIWVIFFSLSASAYDQSQDLGYQRQQQMKAPPPCENWEEAPKTCTTFLGGRERIESETTLVRIERITVRETFRKTDTYSKGERCSEDFPIEKVVSCQQKVGDGEWREINCEDITQQVSLKKREQMNTPSEPEEKLIDTYTETVNEYTSLETYTVTKITTNMYETTSSYCKEWDIPGKECKQTKKI